MTVITSSLSADQEKQLLSLLGHVRLHLLYKASVHGYTAAAFHKYCDKQGPTVIAAFNGAGFVFGAYTTKDYTQNGQATVDEEAFLYSISAARDRPLRVACNDGQCAFTDVATGPNYGGLVFLHDNTARIHSKPGPGFTFQSEQMHGTDLALTEFEVYRVERERKEKLMKSIQDYKPDIKSVSSAKVLLVGAVGSGKSSMFNSLNSVFRGNMTSQAICGTQGKSVTTQFRTFPIKVGKGGKTLPLIVCDTMGLEDNAESGLDMEDVLSIYKGHILDRYQFNPSVPLHADAPGYKKQVTLRDMIHCVVYVVDTCKISVLSDKMLEKLAAIRKRTNQLGVPQLLLMTKVDEACPLVAEDLRNVYLSVYIQRKAQELSASLGIPLSCVLPVKNYSQELELDLNTDVLLLSAVEQMLNYADSFFENQVVEEQEVDDQPELDKSQTTKVWR